MDAEITTERSRAQIYELLALIYERELSVEVIDALRAPSAADAFREAGVDIAAALNGRSRDELASELAVEYARLFLGPGRHIPPYESVHRPDTEGGGLLWGEVTAQIKGLVESLNLCYDKKYKGLPDHISIELELMRRLIDYRIASHERADDAGARRALELENRLMDEHIIKWVPQFCEKVIKQTSSGFYRAMASFTKEFILAEGKNISNLLRTKGGEV